MSNVKQVVDEIYEKELKVGYGQFMDVMNLFADTIDPDMGIIMKSEEHESVIHRFTEIPNKLNIYIDISDADPAVLNKCTANIVTNTVNILTPDALDRDNVPFLGRRLFTRKMFFNRIKGIKYYTSVSVKFKGKEYIHSYDYSVNPGSGDVPAFGFSIAQSIVSNKSGCYLTGYDDTGVNSISLWVNPVILRKYYDSKLFDYWILVSFRSLSEYTSNPFEFRKVIKNVGNMINLITMNSEDYVTVNVDAHSLTVTKNNNSKTDKSIGVMGLRSRYITEKTLLSLL